MLCSHMKFMWIWLERSFYQDFLYKEQRGGIFIDLLKFLETFVHQDTTNRFKLLMIKVRFVGIALIL